METFITQRGKKMKLKIVTIILLVLLTSCGSSKSKLTDEEKRIIAAMDNLFEHGYQWDSHHWYVSKDIVINEEKYFMIIYLTSYEKSIGINKYDSISGNAYYYIYYLVEDSIWFSTLLEKYECNYSLSNPNQTDCNEDWLPIAIEGITVLLNQIEADNIIRDEYILDFDYFEFYDAYSK
jgi:hypothetical protein